MGTRGPMLTVVPTSLCSALLQLKNNSYCPEDLSLKKSYAHDDTETLLSPQYCEIGDAVKRGKWIALTLRFFLSSDRSKHFTLTTDLH